MQEGGGGRLGVDTCRFREAMSTLQRQWFRVVAASGAAACAFALFVDGAEAAGRAASIALAQMITVFIVCLKRVGVLICVFVCCSVLRVRGPR